MLDFIKKGVSAIFGNFMKSMVSDVAIDLGTANTLIYVEGEGIVLEEPSFIAIDRDKNKIYAIGTDAKNMWGRAPKNIEVVRPINDGVVAYYDEALLMLREFLKRVYKRLRLVRPRMAICVPSKITQVEKRAVIDMGTECGAREVLLIDEPMAAAIGAGLPINEPKGCMVVDIGGGTTDVAVISMGGVAEKDSIRIAGYEMDVAIKNYVRDKYHLVIGLLEAEEVKIRIGSAVPTLDEETYIINGRDLTEGVPKEVELTSDEVREAISEPVNAIIDVVRRVLDNTTPELVSDIARNGIVITGGGSLLKGLDKAMEERLRVKVVRTSEPLLTVVLGTGKALEDLENYRRAFIN